MVDSLTDRLNERFGLPSFRPWQREAIDELLAGSGRVLLVAPTGGGKSLCYQFPASELPGTTLVVSPLIALMEDQVRSLSARAIRSTWLSATVAVDELHRRERALQEGAYRLVYVAPERFGNPSFMRLLRSLRPPLVAVDEAHCIAQWGHDFRPDYRRLGAVLDELQPPRILACTATATPRVRDEIAGELGLLETPTTTAARVILRGFARPNLHLAAEEIDRLGSRRRRALASLEDLRVFRAGAARRSKGVAFSGANAAGAAIVYAGTRKLTEKVAIELLEAGYRVAAYHAGLPPEQRAQVNDRFAHGALDVVVATNAFGMGIDRPDIRAVIHLQAPGSIEAYYQEVGRAGRDGEPAYGLLLTGASDFGLRRRLVDQGDFPPALRERRWKMFVDLMRYAEAGSCRHDFILRYFGDEHEMLGGCGHCDVCEQLSQRDQVSLGAVTHDASTVVRKALSGVARARQHAGLTAVAEMLAGVGSKRLERLGLMSLSTFGLLSHGSRDWVLALLRRLMTAEFVTLAGDSFPVPVLTAQGVAVMKGTAPCRVLLPPDVGIVAPDAKRPHGKRGAKEKGHRRDALQKGSGVATAEHAEGSLLADAGILDQLRATRLRVAREQGVPAFVVLHDRTLIEIAARRPQSLHELSCVKGVGPAKLERYGEAILSVTAPR